MLHQDTLTSSPRLNKQWKKVLYICEIIQRQNLNPKKFITAFLTLWNSDLAYKRRLWSSEGIDSTMELVKAIQNLVRSRNEGREHWYQFILQEVRNIIHAYMLFVCIDFFSCFRHNLSLRLRSAPKVILPPVCTVALHRLVRISSRSTPKWIAWIWCVKSICHSSTTSSNRPLKNHLVMVREISSQEIFPIQIRYFPTQRMKNCDWIWMIGKWTTQKGHVESKWYTNACLFQPCHEVKR